MLKGGKNMREHRLILGKDCFDNVMKRLNEKF